jgi:peroxiredoxin
MAKKKAMKRAPKKATKKLQKASKRKLRRFVEPKLTALSVGDKAPDFTLVDAERVARSLSEFLGKKTVLAFFPGAFTGVCTREMCAFRDSIARLGELDGQVVGVSVDSPFANKSFAIQNSLSFVLLSDYERKVVKQYDVVLPNFAGLQGYAVAKRAVFVLDKDGIIRYKWVLDDPGVEPNYEDIMKALVSIS